MKIKHGQILFLLLSLPLFVSAQNWKAPEEANSVVAPFLFNEESIKAGEILYIRNCQSCHGPIGKNLPAPISPVPEDPASDKFQAQTDGEIFWKITHGKTPMPQFQSVLSEEERWQVISYIRNFNPKYIQPTPAAQGVFNGVRLQLGMSYDSLKKKIRVTAMQIGEGNKLSAFQGAPVQISVQRLFGRMIVGETAKTDASGLAYFDFPPDIPGDTLGFVEVRASVNQEGIIAKPAVSRMQIGKPVIYTELYTRNQMWSRKGEGPLWLSLFYGSVIATVWIFIIFVIVSVVKIGKSGRKETA